MIKIESIMGLEDEHCDIVVGVAKTGLATMPFVGMRYDNRKIALLNAAAMRACLELSEGSGIVLERDDTGGMMVRLADRPVPLVSMDSLSADKFEPLAAAASCGVLVLLFGHPSDKTEIGMWTDCCIAASLTDSAVVDVFQGPEETRMQATAN